MKKLMVTAAASIMLAAAASATEPLVESRAYYSTNPNGAVGKTATITIDGEFSDWSEDMIIATCGANDICTAFNGSHENNVLDCYALYAAWDNQNLYFAWQMCNTGDTWARPGDGPLTDYGHIGDVPFILALSVDPSKPCMTGKLDNGNFIWGSTSSNGVEFHSHVDHLLFMSGKVGLGTPAMFTGDASGATNYGSNCKEFKSLGIQYNMTNDFAPSHLWRQRSSAEWADVGQLISDPSIVNNIYDPEQYDNLLAGEVEGLKPHDTQYDSFYEIAIPLTSLGIDKEWLETNGIGVRLVATRGESGIDCIPFDPSMVDNVFEPYGKDNSTSHEKDDIDIITYDLASVAKLRDGSQVTPLPNPEPDPTPNPGPDPTPDPDDQSTWTVYFLDNKTPAWENVKTWIWDADNTQRNYTGGTWPGAAMSTTTIEGTTYWTYSFTPDADHGQLKIIFNNGSDQTKDLILENHAVYNRDGKTGELSGVQEVTLSETAFTLNGLTVTATQPLSIYNACGQTIATASTGTIELPAPGLYIISPADGNATKIQVR